MSDEANIAMAIVKTMAKRKYKEKISGTRRHNGQWYTRKETTHEKHPFGGLADNVPRAHIAALYSLAGSVFYLFFFSQVGKCSLVLLFAQSGHVLSFASHHSLRAARQRGFDPLNCSQKN